MKPTFYTLFHTMLAKNGAAQTAVYAREFGFGGVEYYCDAVADVSVISDVAMAKEVREAMSAEGLKVDCVSVAYDTLRLPDSEHAMRKYAEITAALGSPYLHHTLLIQPVHTDDRDEIAHKLSLAADAAVKIAKMAEDYGLVCLYEDQGKYVNGIKNFSTFFEDVKSRAGNVGVCADLGNILCSGEKPAPFISRFIKDIKHVHIKDCSPVPTEINGWFKLKNLPLGEGEVDIPACLNILKDGGYCGAYALELAPELSSDDGIASAIRYLSDKM